MNNHIEITEIIKGTLKVEGETLLELLNMDFSPVTKAVQLIHDCSGKVVVSGIGKSAIVAQKLVATMNSTGTQASFLHTGDALHGDMGIIQSSDVIILISKSGETRELKELLPTLKKMDVIVIGIGSSEHSHLASFSDAYIYIPVHKEADVHNLAPTASTIAHIAVGDAIAMALKHMSGFSTENFAVLHPGGMLGKKLNMTVGQLAKKNEKPVVLEDATLSEVIFEISSKRLGSCCVSNIKNDIKGIITDGDIRRLIEKGGDIYQKTALEIMSPNPKTINSNVLAVDALQHMKNHAITQLIVIDKDHSYFGIVHIHDLIREGLD